MSLKLLYRENNSSTHAIGVDHGDVKGSPLTNGEIDANFKSIDDTITTLESDVDAAAVENYTVNPSDISTTTSTYILTANARSVGTSGPLTEVNTIDGMFYTPYDSTFVASNTKYDLIANNTNSGALVVTNIITGDISCASNIGNSQGKLQADLIESRGAITGGSVTATGTIQGGTLQSTAGMESGGVITAVNSISTSSGNITATNGNVSGETLSSSTTITATGKIQGDSFELPNGWKASGIDNPATFVRTTIGWATNAGAAIEFYKDDSTGTPGYLDLFFGGTEAGSGTSSLMRFANYTGSSWNYVMTLDASGNLSATDFNSTSDVRVKENIETIPNAMEKILQMRGVSFNFKESFNNSDRSTHFGFIAQEIEDIVPELVKTRTDEDTEMKTVSYGNTVALLVEAIKELKQEIEELKQTKSL